jgi:hypothetical protein
MLTTGLQQQRHGTMLGHRIFPLCHPAVVDLDICTQVPTHEGPLRGCGLLDSLRKGRFPFFMPSPPAESGINLLKSRYGQRPKATEQFRGTGFTSILERPVVRDRGLNIVKSR